MVLDINAVAIMLTIDHLQDQDCARGGGGAGVVWGPSQPPAHTSTHPTSENVSSKKNYERDPKLEADFNTRTYFF